MTITHIAAVRSYLIVEAPALLYKRNTTVRIIAMQILFVAMLYLFCIPMLQGADLSLSKVSWGPGL